MKNCIFLLFLCLSIYACDKPKNSIESADERQNETSHELEEPTVQDNVSYMSLKKLLENNEPITDKYFKVDLVVTLKGYLYDHRIVQDADKYIIVYANDNGTMSKKYYLLSFSKETGKMLSLLEAGQETEGVEPDKISWQSDNRFYKINYQYELLEDEESGAYLRGALLDSTVLNYEILNNGQFIPVE